MSFEQFEDKRKLWVECFSGKDRNSVCNQINRMLWNYAVFNIIDEARRIASADATGKIEINGILHRFMDECFFESQFLAVRRLTDTAYELTNTERGVSSLIALLKDMEKNRAIITRKNLLESEGLTYDYENYSQEVVHNEDKRSGNLLIYSRIKLRHKQIDWLCRVKQGSRKPSDVASGKIFNRYEQNLNNLSKNIKDYVNKYLAHSATFENRNNCQANNIKITLNDLLNVYKTICRVADFVRVILPEVDSIGLPDLCPDYLEFIDKPLVSSEKVESLSMVWNKFVKEIDSWNSCKGKNVVAETEQII